MSDPKTYARLSDSKNDEGFFVVEGRSLATDEVAQERGLVAMPRGGPGWWYNPDSEEFLPPTEPLDVRRQQAWSELKHEMVRRVSGRIPELDNEDRIAAISGVEPMVDWTSAPTENKEARDIAKWVKKRKSDVFNLSHSELDGFSATSSDPFGDGDGWPA